MRLYLAQSLQINRSGKIINSQFWDAGRKRWNGHRAFKTVDHHHVSCYSPEVGHDDCDIMIVGCADGRWYVEDNWGGDAKGADKVWNPFNKDTPEPFSLRPKM